MREMLKRKSFQEAKKKYDDSLKNSCITTLLYKRFKIKKYLSDIKENRLFKGQIKSLKENKPKI
jgi:hypothetical protein